MTTLFGIRHHGPGCARSLLVALAELAPDVILLEMPMELEPLLEHAVHEAMKPPVAMMLYRTDSPEQSSFYPFADFSPEWNAIRWAFEKKVPIRCFDLPSAHMFALRETDELTPPRPDAFEWLAKADGYSDGERWWNDRVEERRDHKDFFEAILVAVTELRRELAMEESRETLLREAWMRKCLRAAEKDGFTNIAVICGAWHAPALQGAFKVSEDNALLKGLEKHKVAATWIPWTDERLTYASGYGAGVRSPGWYRHLWKNPSDPIPKWLTKAARILRGEGQEASSASVIEALRLSNSLAGLRGRPLPGLDETLQAMQSVFCQGDALPLDFLNNKLLIGDRLGELPADLPALPLQQDIDATIRRLRLKPTAAITPVELDLREEGGLARSVFLHRLLALEVPWGEKQQARSKGTFKEVWRLQWNPKLVVAIIDASAFGNTVESAATMRLTKSLTEGESIAAISTRLDLALLGDLPAAVGHLLHILDAAAATSHDIAELLDAAPALAQISRYGNVRATDSVAVSHLLAGFAARIHAGLLAAASGISEEAADPLMRSIAAYSSALAILEDGALAEDFRKTLSKMVTAEMVHPKLRGHAVRLLRDASHLDDEAVARHFSFALSPGMPALAAAAWLEGFLQGGGSLLVYDPGLLHLVDSWLSALSDDGFQAILPLLRRTFGTFSYPERARIAGSLATPGTAPSTAPATSLNLARALPAVQAVARLFALEKS
jgi:hypothetical protein